MNSGNVYPLVLLCIEMSNLKLPVGIPKKCHQ